MNLILIHPHEWPVTNQSTAEIELSDRRYLHIRKVLDASIGDELRIGLVNGQLGTAKITQLNEASVSLEVQLSKDPPPPSPATLVLALPRPKVLKRTLQTVTSLGVKDIYLINSYRVEKSFWQTPFLEEKNLLEQLTLGLEQSQDTILPKIHLRKRFKPFVEDELTSLVTNKKAIVAHPKNTTDAFPHQIQEPCCIAIGPEGGFIPYEIERLESVGFEAKTLGPRILKVESAVSVLLGRCL